MLEEVTITRDKESDITVRIREELSDEGCGAASASSKAKRHGSRTETRTPALLHSDEGTPKGSQPTGRPHCRVIYRYVDGTTNFTKGPTASKSPTNPEIPLSPRAAIAERQANSRQFTQVLSPHTTQQAVANSPVTGKAASVLCSDVRKTAREELNQYGESLIPPPPPTPILSQASLRLPMVTQSEIRKIAHGEIKRYREAERRLDAHPHAYRHGTVKLVQSGHLQPPQQPALIVPSVLPLHRPSGGTHAIRTGSAAVPATLSLRSTEAPLQKATAAAPSLTHAVPAIAPERQHFDVHGQSATVSPSLRAARQQVRDTDYLVVEHDIVEGSPESTYRYAHRDWEVSHSGLHNTTFRSMSLAASTVEPSSSISQRPARCDEASQERVRDSHSTREGHGRYGRPPPPTVPASGPAGTSRHRHMEPRLGMKPDNAGEGLVLQDPPATSGLQNNAFIESTKSSGHHQMIDNSADSLRVEDEKAKFARSSNVELPGRVPFRHHNGMSELSSRFDSRRSAAQKQNKASAIFMHHSRSYHEPLMNEAPPLLSRETQGPKDSVAMLRASRKLKPSDQDYQSQPTARFVDRREFIRPRLSPPSSEDVIHERRKFYRDRSSSGERVIEERIVTARRRSPERRSHGDRSAHKTRSLGPDTVHEPIDRGRLYQRSSEMTFRPRSILRSPSGSPRDQTSANHGGYHVAFASQDDVAILPRLAPLEDGRDISKGMGISRFRRDCHHQEPDDQVDDDGLARTRYTDDEEKTYIPEPKRSITRAFSESPSRERGLSASRQQEESYSHGPYHAEISPTASMEVLNDIDSSRFGDGAERRCSQRVDEREMETPSQRSRRQRGEYMDSANDRGWTRYVNVKEYRDEEGPWVEVKETVVLDEDE
ncbi:hypothetical protein MBLNU459_g7879t1 [Dothideomycetes sp. NU459]